MSQERLVMKGRKSSRHSLDETGVPLEVIRGIIEVGLDMHLIGVYPAGVKSEEGALKATEVGRWNRANQIHRWFVENVQNGLDDYRAYPVSREQLQGLHDAIDTILKARLQKERDELAVRLLPTQPGFFFGDTDYSDSYYDDLTHTRDILLHALSDEFKNWSFLYQASW
jgi:hypothetical protein